MRSISSFWFLLLICGLSGCGGGDDASDQTSTSSENAPAEREDSPVVEQKLPLPEFPTGLCRVYSESENAIVLVDGQPARDDKGTMLHPPCEIRVPTGSRTITLSAIGMQDFSRQVNVSAQSEVEFPKLSPAEESSVVTASAPLFNAKVGEPIPLTSVNSPGAELDPYLSPDGLTLWFAGDRGGARGIYVAYRSSLWHEFGEPELLLLTRGPSVPSSPSLSDDGLAVYYGVPDDARLWIITRTGPLARFDEKNAVLFSQQNVDWPASQVSPDGLRAYWIERNGSNIKGFAAVRKSTDERFSQPIDYPLPGLVPMLSDDALRQYEFDGKTLRRWRRSSLSESFTVSEELQTLALDNYVPAPDRRQFYLTPDEQWMFYCADPQSQPDLFAVRLTEQPRWGVAPIGKAIPPKPKMAVAEMKPDTPNESASNKSPSVNEVAPHPYSVYSQTWRELVSERKYAEAGELTRRSLADPALQPSKGELQNDLELLQDLQRFRGLAKEAFASMKPGAAFNVGTVRVEFVELADETLHFKLGMQTKMQPFFELPATSLALVAEAAANKEDPNVRASIALFQLFDKEPKIPTILGKVSGDPALMDRILKHAAGRSLHEARLEFERGQFVPGFELIQTVMQNYPDTAAAEQARELERSLYEKTDWQVVGGREWELNPAAGLFGAAEGRVENSYIRSPQPMKNYDLQFEWKTSGRVGQGGIYFHYPGEGNVFSRGFKIQLANDVGVAPDQYSTGSLFGREAPSQNAVRAQSEWNQSRLIVRGSNIVFWLNGVKVLDTIAIDDNIGDEGFVLLDGVTGGITYRHVLLMKAD